MGKGPTARDFDRAGRELGMRRDAHENREDWHARVERRIEELDEQREELDEQREELERDAFNIETVIMNARAYLTRGARLTMAAETNYAALWRSLTPVRRAFLRRFHAEDVGILPRTVAVAFRRLGLARNLGRTLKPERTCSAEPTKRAAELVAWAAEHGEEPRS